VSGGADVRVTWDGAAIEAERGQTIAGMLAANGIRSWRTTRRGGRPRGLFCGIGVCFDCLVRVNGIPDVRACQRLVADGDDIRPQAGAELPSADRSEADAGPGAPEGAASPTQSGAESSS
jgi:predicted molibdopterin-dependent oxidoreductase YjgC